MGVQRIFYYFSTSYFSTVSQSNKRKSKVYQHKSLIGKVSGSCRYALVYPHSVHFICFGLWWKLFHGLNSFHLSTLINTPWWILRYFPGAYPVTWLSCLMMFCAARVLFFKFRARLSMSSASFSCRLWWCCMTASSSAADWRSSTGRPLHKTTFRICGQSKRNVIIQKVATFQKPLTVSDLWSTDLEMILKPVRSYHCFLLLYLNK